MGTGQDSREQGTELVGSWSQEPLALSMTELWMDSTGWNSSMTK